MDDYDFYLKFHTLKSKVPEHQQRIVYIKREYSHGAEGISLREDVCLYEWIEIDEDGEETGTTACFQEADEPKPNYVLGFMIGEMSWRLDREKQNLFWIDEEEYWKQFEDFEENPLNRS